MLPCWCRKTLAEGLHPLGQPCRHKPARTPVSHQSPELASGETRSQQISCGSGIRSHWIQLRPARKMAKVQLRKDQKDSSLNSVANRYCARLRLNSPPVSVFVGTYGVFLKPIMADMGWDRGTASFALSAGTFYSAFVFPVFGRMMDRRTIRAVALPAIVAYGIFWPRLGSHRTVFGYS